MPFTYLTPSRLAKISKCTNFKSLKNFEDNAYKLCEAGKITIKEMYSIVKAVRYRQSILRELQTALETVDLLCLTYPELSALFNNKN